MLQKILVVDDEPLMQRILSEEFKDVGYEVHQASNGDAAFQIVSERDIDLIVSDMKMPGMSGIQLLQKIQSQRAVPPPMILVSAFSETKIHEAYAAGFQGVFTKPIEFEALIRAVRKRLKTMREQYIADNRKCVDGPTISCSLPKLNEDLRNERLSLGRGGFFLQMKESFPRKGHIIQFTMHLGESGMILEGQGIVRWVRSHDEPNVKTGIGVEFLSLTPASLDLLEPLLMNLHKPFIPLT